MIQVQGLTKRFGAFLAIEDVSFEAQAGEILALVGPNGSGKSTTMKCIAGLIAPTQGQIVLDGVQVTQGKRHWLSYLPQKVNFPETLTGVEIIEFYRRLRKLAPACSKEAIAVSQLNGFSKRAVREYSVGMQQRLGIAIALMSETPVVVLDEPSAGLDPEAVARLRELLATMRMRGQTVIVSTHVLSELETLADRVAILVHGKLMACEPIERFRDRMSRQGRMRIVVGQLREDWRQRIASAGAVSAEMDGSQLAVTAPPANHLAILKALEDSGACVERFSTEQPTLESSYLGYTRETIGPSDHR